ncbi:unnamed protein product, partial [Trichogramma brassicae]
MFRPSRSMSSVHCETGWPQTLVASSMSDRPSSQMCSASSSTLVLADGLEQPLDRHIWPSLSTKSGRPSLSKWCQPPGNVVLDDLRRLVLLEQLVNLVLLAPVHIKFYT